LHPHLTDETPAAPNPTSTIVASIEHLDLATVIKVSQAVSGEIVPEKLIGTLMRAVIEHAGAERGILILPHGAELRMEAEATTSGDTFSIHLREERIADAVLPVSIVHHVACTRESVILDDASAQNPFSADKYIGQRRTRSILCLPLIKQTTLIGVLYLENNLMSHVFTPSRVAVLELLASQAAISLENARLYVDLEQREAKIRRLVDANIIGISIWDFDGRIIEANEAVLHILGRSRDDIVSGGLRWTDLTPTEWQDADERAVAELRATGSCKPYEKEYLRNDGSHVSVLVGSATLGEHRDQGVSFILDLTERKQAEKNLRESQRRNREAQMELAHVNRVTTMGQLTASIAHEVNQPIAAAVTSAEAGLRWLAAQPPNLVEVRDAFDRIIKAGGQAGGVIGRIRAVIRKVPERKALLDINETILETTALTRSEMRRHRVLLQTELANSLPRIWGDRVQLQQVILNLIMNAIEAMSEVSGGSPELLISTEAEAGCVLVSIRDTGPGLSQVDLERVFQAFYTTKSSGLGMGLSICRSIIEAFGGRLWATANVPQGAIFQFTVPAHPQANTTTGRADG
jgi:PAS domain S-box-containing protein